MLIRLTALLFAMLATIPAIAAPAKGNEEVLKLIKAGLTDAIVLRAIDTSKSEFDTSTDAIIALKKAGASEAVLSRIYEKSAKPDSPPAAKPSTLSQSAATNGGACKDEAPPGTLAFLDEGTQKNFRPTRFKVESDVNVMSAIGMSLTMGASKAKVKGYLVIAGAESKNKTSGNLPIMKSVGILNNRAPEDSIRLVRLTPHDGDRKIVFSESSVGLFKAKSTNQYPPEQMIDIDMQLTQADCSATAQGGKTYTLNMFDVKPKGSLPPGEYALLVDGAGAIDFSVTR